MALRVLWLIGVTIVVGTSASPTAEQARTPPRADAVPDAVQRVLDNVGCHRPQGAPGPTIARGHFVRANQDDWAALCVSGKSSFIYVVWGGTAQCPAILATRANTAFDASGGVMRTLRTSSPTTVQTALRTSDKPGKKSIDHDGIDDALDGSAHSIHYCLNRSWVSVPGSN